MKQLDKETESKLNLLLTPLVIVAIVFACDLLLSLNMNAEDWGVPVMLGCAVFPVVGFSIAYIRQKCWGLLVFSVVLLLLMLLNMSNYFVDLLYPLL